MGSVARAAPGASHGNSPQAAIYGGGLLQTPLLFLFGFARRGHKSLPRTLGRLFLRLGPLKNCSLSASGQQGPPAGFCPMPPEHGQAFKGQMDAPHRLLLDEMARCQLAASMVTHDVTEAVACPAPPSAWSASLASALPADGGVHLRSVFRQRALLKAS